MAAKNKADLTTDNNNNIVTQVLPDSIDPVVLGAMLQEIIDSYYNIIDGITVGTILAPLIIPAGYTPTVLPYGQQLQSIIQAILNFTNATQIAVTGGIQGLPGEFVAKIMPEDIIVRKAAVSGAVNLGPVQFINDNSNGGFDNGNNWLLDTHKVPVGGFAGKYRLTGATLKDVLSIFASIGSHADFVLKIVKTTAGVPTTLATSNTLTFGAVFSGTEPIGFVEYFNDLVYDCGITPLLSGDLTTVELHSLAGGRPDLIQLQITSGLFSAKL